MGEKMEIWQKQTTKTNEEGRGGAGLGSKKEHKETW